MNLLVQIRSLDACLSIEMHLLIWKYIFVDHIDGHLVQISQTISWQFGTWLHWLVVQIKVVEHDDFQKDWGNSMRTRLLYELYRNIWLIKGEENNQFDTLFACSQLMAVEYSFRASILQTTWGRSLTLNYPTNQPASTKFYPLRWSCLSVEMKDSLELGTLGLTYSV